MPTEALLKRETKAQESGNKVAAIHRRLPGVGQLTAQFIDRCYPINRVRFAYRMEYVSTCSRRGHAKESVDRGLSPPVGKRW
jgi:hypothetical protein